ncbi:MAG: hypothetical protein Q7T87_22075 [Polaromonas sp.]|nr:hypothetical protein [Polaromonas sp.]
MKVNPPAGTGFAQKLEALSKRGITGHGVFQLQAPPAGGGYARVEFQGPKMSAKPFFLKAKVSSDYTTQLAVYRAEKALKFRGAIFAALANPTFDARSLETLATKLAKQGTKGGDLNQLDWSMGQELLNGSDDGKTKAESYKKWATQAAANLVKFLHSDAGKALPDGAREVLARLEFGIATSEGAEGLAPSVKLATLIKEQSGLQKLLRDKERGISGVPHNVLLAAKSRLTEIDEVEKPQLIAAATRFNDRSRLAPPPATTTATATSTATTTLTTTTTTTGGTTLTAHPQVDAFERELKLLEGQRSASANVLSEYRRGTGAFTQDQAAAAQNTMQLLDVAIVETQAALNVFKMDITSASAQATPGAQSKVDRLEAELQLMGDKHVALNALIQDPGKITKAQLADAHKEIKKLELEIRAQLLLKAQAQQDALKTVKTNTTNTTNTSTSQRS